MYKKDIIHGGLIPATLNFRTVAKSILGKRGFSNVDLIARWADIMGEELSQGVLPDKITYPRGERINGTLHVKVSSGAFATLLEHRQKVVLDRVNNFLGYTAVKQIHILQEVGIPLWTVPPKETAIPVSENLKKEIESQTQAVSSPELKEALQSLGETILRKELANDKKTD